MRILIGVCGSISAYKALDVISGLQSLGHEVKTITTKSAEKFITPQAIGSIGEYVEESINGIEHIDLANWCDIFAVVSATANTISKMANGTADNFLTSTYLAVPTDIPVLVFPAMNTKMLSHPATKRNICQLQVDGVKVYNTRNGVLACGDIGKGKLLKPRHIVRLISDYNLPIWKNPLAMECVGTSNNSNSFFEVSNLKQQYEILLHPHCGSFGVRRRHDYHKGIDLYAPIGTPVYAVEDGEIIAIKPFTGKDAGCDWWNDTWGIYIKGQSGIVVYGEIKYEDNLTEGDTVIAGELLGTVLQVLKNDKGRPTSMLHLELHEKDSLHTDMWVTEKPKGLLNPTNYLLKMMDHD